MEEKENYKDIIRGFFVMLAAILFSLLVSRFFRPIIVSGASMEPTYSDGDVLLGFRIGEIERGQIIIFKQSDLGELLIKRVIGLPGDTVEIKDNGVSVNEETLAEDYLKEPMKTDDFIIELGADEYFVMGDNRNNSYDSRIFGPVKEDEICYHLRKGG